MALAASNMFLLAEAEGHTADQAQSIAERKVGSKCPLEATTDDQNSTERRVHSNPRVQKLHKGKKHDQKKKHAHKKHRPSSYTKTKSKASSASPTPTSTSTGSGSDSGSGSSGSTGGSDFSAKMVELHNAKRALHGAPALSWDADLASKASSWAQGCKWGHTPNINYGQNLAMGTGDSFGADQSVKMWYDEVKQYNFASGGFSSATGHFTQLVWKATTKLGCAVETCSNAQLGMGSSGSGQYVVCK